MFLYYSRENHLPSISFTVNDRPTNMLHSCRDYYDTKGFGTIRIRSKVRLMISPEALTAVNVKLSAVMASDWH